MMDVCAIWYIICMRHVPFGDAFRWEEGSISLVLQQRDITENP